MLNSDLNINFIQPKISDCFCEKFITKNINLACSISFKQSKIKDRSLFEQHDALEYYHSLIDKKFKMTLLSTA